MFVDCSDATSIQAFIDAGVSAFIADGLKKERIKPTLRFCVFVSTRFEERKGHRPRQENPDEAEEPHKAGGLRSHALHRDARENRKIAASEFLK